MSWVPLLGTVAAPHRVMLDAIGDVNKSVATKPRTTPAQIVTLVATYSAAAFDQFDGASTSSMSAASVLAAVKSPSRPRMKAA